MGWIERVNALYNAFLKLVNDANIKNKRGIAVKVYQRALPPNFSKEDCPAIAVMKDNVSGRRVETDQPDLEKPCELRIVVGLSDYSMVDLDDADTLTDDLVNKLLNALGTDPSLGNLSKGIRFENIQFDFDRREGIWYSEPTLNFSVEGTEF